MQPGPAHMVSTTTAISREGGLQDHTASQPTKSETIKDPQTDIPRPRTGLGPYAMGGQGTGKEQGGGREIRMWDNNRVRMDKNSPSTGGLVLVSQTPLVCKGFLSVFILSVFHQYIILHFSLYSPKYNIINPLN